jgi:hypothetical protein
MKLLVDRRAGDLAVKERVVRHLLDDLGRLTDPLLQELYRKELARSFALSEATVSASLHAPRAKTARGPRPAEPAAAAGSVRPAVLEAQRGLLRLGLSAPGWVERLAAELEAADFDPGPPRRLFEVLSAAHDPAIGGGRWIDAIEDESDRAFASELLLEDLPPGEPEQLFHDYLAAFKGARLEAAEGEVQRELAEAEARGDRDLQLELLARQRALATERSQLKKRATWT